MTSLKRIWSDKRLTLDIKLPLCQTLVVVSVLLYAADTWPLLSADVRTLDSVAARIWRWGHGIWGTEVPPSGVQGQSPWWVVRGRHSLLKAHSSY